MDAIGLAEPTLRRPYPRVDPDPAIHFHNWLTTGAIDGQDDGTPYLSYFAYERTFWDAPHGDQPALRALRRSSGRPDRRDAADRGLPRDRHYRCRIERMARSASFESMRQNADVLIPEMAKNFEGGALRLVNKGQSGRWRGVYDEADVELFDRKLRAAVPDAYADWLLAGRIAGSSVDPSQM